MQLNNTNSYNGIHGLKILNQIKSKTFILKYIKYLTKTNKINQIKNI